MNKIFVKIYAVLFLIFSTICVNFLFSNFSSDQVFASEQTNITVSNVYSEVNYNYINGPCHITAVSSTDFYLCDKENKIYRYKNNNVEILTDSFPNLISIYYYNNYLYILELTKISVYNPTNKTVISTIDLTSLTNFENPLEIKVNENGCFVCNKTSLIYFDNRENITTAPIKQENYEDNLATFNFSNIKDFCISQKDKFIYVLHSNENYLFLTTFKLDGSPYNKFTQLNSYTLSNNGISLKQNLECFDETNLFISNENKLYTINFDSLSNDIFTSPILSPTINHASYKYGEIKNIKDFCIIENKLLICDDNSACNSVQCFDVSQNKTLNFSYIAISSCGADNERLYNPKDLSLNNKTLYILDSGNNRIIRRNLENNEIISLIDITSPKNIATNSNEDIFVVNGSTEQYLNIYNQTDKEMTTISLNDYSICDIEITTNDLVLLLDYSENKLLYLDSSYNIHELTTLQTINLTSSARIKTNASCDLIYIFADNTIYSIKFSTLVPTIDNKISQLQISGEIIDFDIDYLNNIYCLINVDGSTQIQKFTSATIRQDSITLPKDQSYSSITLNLMNGQFYSINDKCSNILQLQCTNNFTNKLADYEVDYSFRDNPCTIGATIAEVTTDIYSYKQPYCIEKYQQLKEKDLVIILKETVSENKNFAYCMISNKENVNILAYVETKFLNYDLEEEKLKFKEVYITADEKHGAYIYHYPTSLGFYDNRETSCKYEQKTYYGDTFKLLGYAHGYTDYSKMGFCEVELEDGSIGYIKKGYISDSEIVKRNVTLQSNAIIKTSLEDDIVYLYDLKDNNYIQTTKTLKNNQKIELVNSFDSSCDFTLVKYTDEKGLIQQAYVETKFIEYEDLTFLKIIGFILLIITIVIAFLVISLIIKSIKKKKIEFERD